MICEDMMRKTLAAVAAAGSLLAGVAAAVVGLAAADPFPVSVSGK